MKQSGYWTIALLFVMGSTAFAQSARTPDSPLETWRKTDLRMNDNCSACHQRLGEPLAKQVGEWQGSAHARNGIFCDSCHGGDPISTVLVVAMGAQNGFKPAPQPKDVPEDCGRCHQEALASFTESAHGELFESNAYEPSCVTCHNSHNVQDVSFNLVSLEASCGACHDQNYINEVRNPLNDTNEKLIRLRSVVTSLPKENPNTAYLRSRLDKASHEFSGLAHFLSSTAITAKRQSLDRELQYLEFMVSFDDTKPGN